jgi:hypothetical protein
MTNKEFFVQILESERPIFRSVLDALPEDKHSHKVHDKSREAGNLATQLAAQWEGISGVITKGVPDMPSFGGHAGKPISKAKLLEIFDQSFDQMKKDLATISDEDWENGMGKMEFPGGKWEDKKYLMSWGFLFDGIHHRGQLSSYLRAMGAKVPSIYGGSADSQGA